ncbi:hypothetical protein IMSHALPRED_003149 [Imshaugia aleurites]|uniref:Uncharacterized protein n=1 Tax=Imshaugia aleurites TaxID=172621 RepID=A0A8H3J7S0_9LECA|nr:hypothetical protein IMSHALPRED_003149 [Imshaugia aleurites]
MVIPAPDPLSAISSSFNATIKILEVTYQLKAVDEQTADLLSTTRHVDLMVQEAHRLRRLKAGLLNASERTMIDKVISDTEDALRAVAKLVEPCRVDKNTKNTIRFGTRVMWVFRDNPSVRDKHQRLQVCHQSLTVVFTCLYSKDVVVIAPALEGRSEEQPPPYDPQLKELLDWQNRRKRRKGPEEKEFNTAESMSLMSAGSNDVTNAGPLSPCLLAVPLEENVEASSFSTHFSDTSFEIPTRPTNEAQPSTPHNKDSPLSPAIASPELDSHSPHMSAHDAYSHDGTQNRPPTTHTNAPNTYISPAQEIPEIDSPSFAAMIAPYGFENNENNDLKADHEHHSHAPYAAFDQNPSTPAIAAEPTPSSRSCPPKQPSSTFATPTSSEPIARYDLGLRWPESSEKNSYSPQGRTEASSAGQYLLPARANSDIQLSANYQSDRLDAIARAEDALTRDDRAVSVGQGVAKRGGRSWLAYHATRSDTAHGMDWNG